MKPDPDYIKKILDAFREHSDPTMDISQLAELGLSYQMAEFYFHMRLLNDQGFVERDDEEPGLGVNVDMSGNYSWSAVPLRLTASGHAFAEAMGNSKAFEAVKKSLVSSSLSIMRDIAVAAFKAELAKFGAQLG